MTVSSRSTGRASSLFGLAVWLLAAQAATGLVLMFLYRPAALHAYLDLVDLREVSRLGFVRGLHFWGAQAALLAVWLHLLRIFLRGGFRPPRHRGWTTGVALLVLVALLAVTGSVLVWDEDVHWLLAGAPDASTPGASTPGTSTPGASTPDDDVLITSYVLHCALLPLLTGGLLVHSLRRPRQGD